MITSAATFDPLVGELGGIGLHKNDVDYTRLAFQEVVATNANNYISLYGSTNIYLAKDDYIHLEAIETFSNPFVLAAASSLNWISIHKIGDNE
jgi:hypothetical protein